MSDLITNNMYPQQIQGRTNNPQNSGGRTTPSQTQKPSMGSIPAANTTSPPMGTIPANSSIPPGTMNPAMAGISSEEARAHIGNNTAGAVVENATQTGNPLITFAYGVGAALGSTKLINWLLLNKSKYEDTRFNHILNRLDKSEFTEGRKLWKIKDFISKSPLGTLGRKFKENPVIKHIKEHSGKLKPKNGFAYAAYRPLHGELAEELMDKIRDTIIKKDAREFVSEFVETTDKKGLFRFFRKPKLKQVVPPEEVLKKFGINDFSEKFLKKNLPGNIRKVYKKCQEASQKGNEKAVKKFLGKLINATGNAYGTQNNQAIIAYYDKVRMGKVSTEEAIKKMSDLAQNHGLDKEKYFIRYINDMKALLPSAGGKGVFAGTLRNAFKAVKRCFRIPLISSKLAIPFIGMMAFSVGGTIKKTFDAPKEDKFKTFMEATLGEMLPFWILYSPLMRGMENGINILQNIPVDKFKGIGGFFAKAGSGIGKLLAAGLEKGPSLARFGKFAGLIGFTMGLARLALFMKILQPVMEMGFKKGTHLLFGKPQATIDEENAIKAEKEREKAKKSGKIEQIPEVNEQFFSQPPSVVQNEAPSPLVQQYKNMLLQSRGVNNNPNINMPQSASGISNLYTGDGVQPAYDMQAIYSEPEPVAKDPQKVAEFNAALAEIDDDILHAEKLLYGG